MATTKPTKPNITLPPSFGTSASNVKTAYTAQELIDGYSASIQQILNGGNLNWLNDTFFKYLTYTTALCDWLNGCGTKQIPYINSSNQLDYYDLPAGIPIGQIIQVNCTADYIPDGCLPCDGQQYTKAQFNELWTNYLTSSPAKLLTCSYADYQTDITTYGQCAKFAIDTTNNVFKVPTLPNKLVTGQVQNVPVKGNGMTLGLTNGTTNFGLQIGTTGTNSYLLNTSQLGKSVGTSYVSSDSNVSSSVGITTDSTKSGLVADLSTNTVTLRSFVVVSNGQINQASMDWSQWATSLAGRLDTNASNATATGKSTIVGWGVPDYSSAITLSESSFPYTAPSNGFIRNVVGTAQNQYGSVTISGVTFTSSSGSSSDVYHKNSILIPVAKNDVISHGDRFTEASFIPMKGNN